MEIKQAFFSSNISIASSAQNVASGIEIAAARPGGISAIADSFQSFEPSKLNFEIPGQFAPSAAIDSPSQYATRLNQFNRETSGLVSSSDLAKQMSDLNPLLPDSLEYFIGVCGRLVKNDVKNDLDQMKQRLDQLKKEAEERADANSTSFWNQMGSIFGDDGGGSELQVAIKDMLSRFQDAVSMGSQVSKKIRDASNDMTRKIG
jgi:hypothetical protein